MELEREPPASPAKEVAVGPSLSARALAKVYAESSCRPCEKRWLTSSCSELYVELAPESRVVMRPQLGNRRALAGWLAADTVDENGRVFSSGAQMSCLV